jgi:hypothetical protein
VLDFVSTGVTSRSVSSLTCADRRNAVTSVKVPLADRTGRHRQEGLSPVLWHQCTHICRTREALTASLLLRDRTALINFVCLSDAQFLSQCAAKVSSAVSLMLKHSMWRLGVERGGELISVITTTDIIRYISGGGSATRPDQPIQLPRMLLARTLSDLVDAGLVTKKKPPSQLSLAHFRLLVVQNIICLLCRRLTTRLVLFTRVGTTRKGRCESRRLANVERRHSVGRCDGRCR